MQRIKKFLADFHNAGSSMIGKLFSRKKKNIRLRGPSLTGRIKGRALNLGARTLDAAVGAAATFRQWNENRNIFNAAARKKISAKTAPEPKKRNPEDGRYQR